MNIDLSKLPDQVGAPNPEDFTTAETYNDLLNYRLKNAELERFLKDTSLRSDLVYIFSVIIFLWLSSVVTILYFNNNVLNLGLSDNVLIALLSTTTINVIGMMLIILRNLFPQIKDNG